MNFIEVLKFLNKIFASDSASSFQAENIPFQLKTSSLCCTLCDDTAEYIFIRYFLYETDFTFFFPSRLKSVFISAYCQNHLTQKIHMSFPIHFIDFNGQKM